MIPPFKTPSNASYFFCGFHSATTSPFFRKLRVCKPSGFATPQPKQIFRGAYSSRRDCSAFIDSSSSASSHSLSHPKSEKAEEEIADENFGDPGYGRGSGPACTDRGRIGPVVASCTIP